MSSNDQQLTVTFTTPTPEDISSYDPGILDGRIKLIVEDSDGHQAINFMEREKYNRLGEDYIREHIRIRFDKFVEEWFVNLSENDYYNDPERNPERVIHVEFVAIETGTGNQIFRSPETRRFFIRECAYPRENFAKWWVCGTRLRPGDGDPPRANLIFECRGQREKVRYDDWNGTAAYSDTFNKDFWRG